MSDKNWWEKWYDETGKEVGSRETEQQKKDAIYRTAKAQAEQYARQERRDSWVKEQVDRKMDEDIRRMNFERNQKWAAEAKKAEYEARKKAELEEERRYEKSQAIAEAKRRYSKKSAFYRMFHKQIDWHKRGVMHHNPDNMTKEQIDMLYGGRSK